jgi:hypothetical protein
LIEEKEGRPVGIRREMRIKELWFINRGKYKVNRQGGVIT